MKKTLFGFLFSKWTFKLQTKTFQDKLMQKVCKPYTQ